MKIVITDDMQLVITTGTHEKHECLLKTDTGVVQSSRWAKIKAVDKETVVMVNDIYPKKIKYSLVIRRALRIWKAIFIRRKNLRRV